MMRLISIVAGAVLVLAPLLTKAQFVCDIPTAGCSNGMFNQGKCECEVRESAQSSSSYLACYR